MIIIEGSAGSDHKAITTMAYWDSIYYLIAWWDKSSKSYKIQNPLTEELEFESSCE